jgi:hypothetical protein
LEAPLHHAALVKPPEHKPKPLIKPRKSSARFLKSKRSSKSRFGKRAFTAEQMQTDPGYAFRLAEGERALERMQAARGQLLGGGAIRAGVRYGQEMGSQEYMNAFNRAQALMGTRLSTLGSLYGAGQAAAQQVGQQAGQYGTNVGNLLMGAGQARASGYLGQANALSQALGQGAMGFGLYRGGYFNPPPAAAPPVPPAGG